MHLEYTIVINQPVEKVFNYVSNPANLARCEARVSAAPEKPLTRRWRGNTVGLSSEEDAEMFLSLKRVGFDSWQARESTAGELISVLYGPCADVKRVALDIPPEMLLERMVGLVSVSREDFANLLC